MGRFVFLLGVILLAACSREVKKPIKVLKKVDKQPIERYAVKIFSPDMLKAQFLTPWLSVPEDANAYYGIPFMTGYIEFYYGYHKKQNITVENFEIEVLPYEKSAYGCISERLPWPKFSADSLEKTIGYERKMYEKFSQKREYLMSFKVVCHEVAIRNTAITDAIIDSNHRVKMIQEALDKDGVWKPIEHTMPDKPPGCGMSSNWSVTIQSGEALRYLVPKYHGNFPTKIRFRVEVNGKLYLSNNIDGAIYRQQFDQSFTDSYLANIQQSYLKEHLSCCFLMEDCKWD